MDERKASMLGKVDYGTATEFRPARLLKPSGCVAVIAPSGPYDGAALAAGIEGLRARFEVRSWIREGKREGYFAASDEERLAGLIAALKDEQVDTILCARGGYGATRLLSRIDPALVSSANKAIMGFSDITALHAVWTRARVRSLHAPMVATMGRTRHEGKAHEFDAWLSALTGHTASVFRELHPIGSGRAAGPLVGGNLAVLTSLVGTPFMPSCRGCVLFLEDVGERPYRLDRMLTQLLDAGVLEGVAAVALGAFTDCGAGTDGVSAEQVLTERLRLLSVPVVAHVSAGHIDDNRPLALGAHAAVDADQGTLTVGGLF